MRARAIMNTSGKWMLYIVVAVISAGAVLYLYGKPDEGVAEADKSAWESDFSVALEISAQKGLPVLADFTGSDWCRFCIMLDNEVFSKEEFQDFAKDNLVLFVADFPRRKEISDELRQQNHRLAERYGIRGFPTVLILDAEGNEIARTGYRPGGAAAYVEHLKELIEQ